MGSDYTVLKKTKNEHVDIKYEQKNVELGNFSLPSDHMNGRGEHKRRVLHN